MLTSIKYFEQLYESVPFPIEVINTEGRVVYVNNPFRLQWGYDVSELREYSVFEDAELKRNKTIALIEKVFDQNIFYFVNNYSDALLKSKEITIPFFKTKIFRATVDEEDYVVLFHEDQTEIILAEEEIKKSRDANLESERLKSTFLNVLSHELRTPLNIILGYASIIKESLKEKTSIEERVYLENLYSGSERLFKSITQMLEFAQIESVSHAMKSETVDLIEVLKAKIKLIEQPANEKGLAVRTVFKNQPIFVDVDIQSIESVINNLLSNAVKFTRRGFIEVEASIVADRDLAVCKIKDTGVGISAEYLDHLFRPFSQEERNVGRNFEGNGLGLALAKRYIEKMGGSLLADSIKGVGSTFIFTLPLSKSKYKEDGPYPYEVKEENLPKILMIEDESGSSELIKAFLKYSYSVEVQDLRGFNLNLLKDYDFKIILFDVTPNLWKQSLLICEDIKKNDILKRPIIIISSESSDNKIRQFLSSGADKFLIKPFSKSELLNYLEKATPKNKSN